MSQIIIEDTFELSSFNQEVLAEQEYTYIRISSSQKSAGYAYIQFENQAGILNGLELAPGDELDFYGIDNSVNLISDFGAIVTVYAVYSFNPPIPEIILYLQTCLGVVLYLPTPPNVVLYLDATICCN